LSHAVYHAPTLPDQRVSLSAEALSQTRALLVLDSGTGKREAVERWRRGEALPVTALHPPGGMDVLLDQAAWGEE
jgi:6-phosphogluconolactonase